METFVLVRHGVTHRVSYVLGKLPIIVSIGDQRRVCGSSFLDLRASIDEKWVFADGSYICCYQHSSGERWGELQAIEKAWGGTTTKIHLAVYSHGNPIDFKITEGDVHDNQAIDDIIEMLAQAAKQLDFAFDYYLYKLRHLVENTFARLKNFRSITTRPKKLARNYKSMLYLACTMIHCKLN